MAHEKDLYEMDNIPDYAMQPAREDTDTFDPAVYEKLFSELAPLEKEEAELIQEHAGDELAALFERMIAAEKKSEAETMDQAEVFGAEDQQTADTAASDGPAEGPSEETSPRDAETMAASDSADSAAGAEGAEAEAAETEAATAGSAEAAAAEGTDLGSLSAAGAMDAEAAEGPAERPAPSETAAAALETSGEKAEQPDLVKAEALEKASEAADVSMGEEDPAEGQEALAETGSQAPAEAAPEAEETAGTDAEAVETGAAPEGEQEAAEAEIEETIAPAVSEEPEETEVMAPAEPVAPGGAMPTAPVSGPAPSKIIPAGSSVISTSLKLTDIKNKPKMRIFIEEDILVPDVKPDLASVLSMEAAVNLSDQQIPVGAQGADSVKLAGDLMVSTLYLPDRSGEEGNIIAIESRIPFKQEADIKGEPYSDLVASAAVESIDYSVINERKFKVKATVLVDLKEYRALNLDLFEGLKDEEVQMLSESIHLTDVAMRRTDSMELSEELPMKDGNGPVGKILCFDVNVVENHKQITAEKAVINGTAYVNAMYLTEEADGSDFDPEEGVQTTSAEPALFQGKAEFTQFIKLEDDGPAERGTQNPVGSKVGFRVAKAELAPTAQNEDGGGNSLTLNLDLETTLELYQDLETDIVTDVYHHMKEMRYDTREVSVMNLCGSGMAEVSAREIINVPEKYGAVDRVVYITGRISDVRAGLDAGKSVTEGVVSLSMICIAAGDEKTPFSLKKDIPFRCAIEVPGVRGDMEVDSDALLKELWYDKINNRQIEVNAGVLVNTAVCSRQKHPLINNVSFVELPENAGNEPGIILYITREGDNVWRIAKKYRTTIENIKKINGIDDSGKLKPGTKLLIVK